jgi:hypothetical protein
MKNIEEKYFLFSLVVQGDLFHEVQNTQLLAQLQPLLPIHMRLILLLPFEQNPSYKLL